MLAIVKLAAVFAAMLLLLRLKWKIGYVLMASSAVLAALYMMPLPTVIATVRTTVTDPVTIELFFALTLIRILEMVLRERQVLSQMTEAAKSILRRKRLVVISMPLLIGLLPSLGGAYFSAPMVHESAKGLNMSKEEKAFANYWYRHPWEYILPLYPGILLVSAVTHLELRSLIIANSALAALMFATGFIFTMRGVTSETASNVKGNFAGFRPSMIKCFIPVITVLLLVIVFHVELFYALLAVIIGLAIFYRFGLKDIARGIKYGFTSEVITLIFGVMLFKFMMDDSGAVVYLSQYLKQNGISLFPILFALPFLSGLLTGITAGFVGSTFPLIINLAGGAHLNEITFAFTAGYIGVLLSPVHLCLVLTREYFKADMWGVYSKIVPACGILLSAAVVEYYLL
jgi:uncharacterized protein